MVQQSPRRLELTVTADQAGEKIDTLLRRELRLSGTVIRRVKWLDDGILLDGMRVTTACRPAAGQGVEGHQGRKGHMVMVAGQAHVAFWQGRRIAAHLVIAQLGPGRELHLLPG